MPRGKSAEVEEKERRIREKMSGIGKRIAVMSGKGGVGKSSVTAMLAVHLVREGKKVGVFDTDFLGPSIPKLFGLEDARLGFTQEGIEPVTTKLGIKVMSIHFMLSGKEQPVIWRGPMIAKVLLEFLERVHWGELDYLLFDLPPGTGDVPLTIMQSSKPDAIVVVTTPQDLAKEIVEKGVNMAMHLGVNEIHLVENMSYFECPNCGHVSYIFGESRVGDLTLKYGLNAEAKIPINPKISELADSGRIEELEEDYFVSLKL